LGCNLNKQTNIMAIYKTIHLNETDSKYVNAILDECYEVIALSSKDLDTALLNDIEEVFQILNP